MALGMESSPKQRNGDGKLAFQEALSEMLSRGEVGCQNTRQAEIKGKKSIT